MSLSNGTHNSERVVKSRDQGAFRQGIIDLLPSLRNFARSLAHNPAQADDLVQDTLVKALTYTDRFEPGTNLRAWLFTILRNHYFSQLRKTKREVEDTEGRFAARLASRPEQDGIVDLEDFKAAFAQLAPDHKEVLLLVGASGASYEEAAEIMGCAIGTVKSRVNRARRKIADLLGLDDSSIDTLPILNDVRREEATTNNGVSNTEHERALQEETPDETLDTLPKPEFENEKINKALIAVLTQAERAGLPDFFLIEGRNVQLNPRYAKTARFDVADGSIHVGSFALIKFKSEYEFAVSKRIFESPGFLWTDGRLSNSGLK